MILGLRVLGRLCVKRLAVRKLHGCRRCERWELPKIGDLNIVP